MILIKIIIAVCLTVAAGTTIEAIIPDEPKAIIEEVQEIPVVEEVKEEENLVTKEILVPIAYHKSTHEKKLEVAELKLLEHEELLTKKYNIMASGDGVVPDLGYKVPYIKITILGPTEVIGNLPDEYLLTKELIGTSYIYAFIDTTNLDVGTHTLSMDFVNPIENVEILTQPIRCQFQIVSKNDLGFPLEAIN